MVDKEIQLKIIEQRIAGIEVDLTAIKFDLRVATSIDDKEWIKRCEDSATRSTKMKDEFEKILTELQVVSE